MVDGVRKLKYTPLFKERKDVILTEGNGSHDALLILGCEGGMDLEALAAPQRELRAPLQNRFLSTALATLWILFLISVAGYDQHSWFVIAVGMIGILHNVGVAGMKREPKAFGIDLEYERTIVAGKVMEVLWQVEDGYSGAGAFMINEFFPGKLFPREQKLWEYAEMRQGAFKAMQKAQAKAKGQGIDAQQPRRWAMPLLRRPKERRDDEDVSAEGEADVAGYVPEDTKVSPGNEAKDHLVQIHE